MAETYTLITGASSGFGRSIAEKLSPTRRLILVGRKAETLEAVRSNCASPERHLVWVRDLSRLERIGEELSAFLVEQQVSVDHFIHSAGLLTIQYARAIEMPSVMQLFNVNAFSALEIVRPLVQKKINQGALRSITFISSVATRVGAAGYSAYSASKGAVNGFALSLAVELAPTVRVNSVLPGIVGTEMNTEHFANPEFVESVLATHPLGLGKAEDVADTVEFLASDKARWITGQEIVVDGGRTIFSPPRMAKPGERL
jgi:NAD(P)-dependent dehydrogenase (short-subunit alcohol dehydrogenase family)